MIQRVTAVKGQPGIYQVRVLWKAQVVIVRVKVLDSTFKFLWSSHDLPEEIQLKICADMAQEFWG